MGAGENDVANLERAALHQHGGHVAATLVKTRLEHGTDRIAVGISLEVKHFGLEEHFFHEIFDANTLFGRNFLALIFAAPVFDQIIHGRELFLDFVRVSVGLIYFIDGKHDGHTCRRGVVDSLDGLGHDGVVGSHDDDDKVGHLGAAGTHGGKGFVAGGVEEGYLLAVGEGHMIGTDMLGNTAGLTRNDVSLADIVEQRGLAVVDMTHDCNNRRTGKQIFLRVFDCGHGLGEVGGDIFGFEAEFFGHNIDSFGIKTLVDADHDTHLHAGGNDVIDGHIHERSQVVGGNELGELQNLAFGLLLLGAFVFAVGECLALLLAPLGGHLLALVALRGQAGKYFLDLLLYVFFADFGRCGLGLAVTVVTTLFRGVLLARLLLVAAAVVIVAVAGIVATTVTAFFLHVDLFAGADALTLLAVAFGSVAALFLGFFLRTGSSVDGRKVNFADNVELRRASLDIVGSVQAKHLGLSGCGRLSGLFRLWRGSRCGRGLRLSFLGRLLLRFGLCLLLGLGCGSLCGSGFRLGFRLDLHHGLSLGSRSRSHDGPRLRFRLRLRFGFGFGSR